MDALNNEQQTNNTESPASADTTNSNPPSTAPATPAPDNTTALLQDLIRQQQEQIRILSQQRQQPQIPRQPETPPDPKEFYEKPHETIRQEVQKAIMPFAGFMQQMQRQSDIKKVCAYVANIPQYTAIFPHIRADFEAALEDLPELNQYAIQQTLQAAVGNYALRNINGQGHFTLPNAAAPAPATSAPRNVPAHLAPSAPALHAPGAPATKPKRQYTEQERRMMREWNMSEEEFDTYQTAAPHEVLDIQIPGARK
jgi:hypothetical protein